MLDYQLFHLNSLEAKESGSVALEFLLITIFTSLLSVALLAAASSYIEEKAVALEQSHGVHLEIPTIDLF